MPLALARARAATDAAAVAMRAEAAGIGAGYQPGTVQDLDAVLAGLTDLGTIRKGVSSRAFPSSQVIRIYSGNLIGPENTLSAAVGGGTGDASLQAAVTTLAALLRVQNDESVQRAFLYAALSARPPVLARGTRASCSRRLSRPAPTWPTLTLPRTRPSRSSIQRLCPVRWWTSRPRTRSWPSRRPPRPSQPLTGITGLTAAS